MTYCLTDHLLPDGKTLLQLLPERAVWYPAARTLIITDLHLGKAAHFSKHGMFLPTQVAQADITRLQGLLNYFGEGHLVITGDLFHSTYNAEWSLFDNLLNINPHWTFTLVMGNHDILPTTVYNCHHLATYKDIYTTGALAFSHKPIDAYDGALGYLLCGHIHPGVIVGTAQSRQRLRLPCFWFGATQAVLPAFGGLTGTAVVKPSLSDAVYGIAEGNIIAIPAAICI